MSQQSDKPNVGRGKLATSQIYKLGDFYHVIALSAKGKIIHERFADLQAARAYLAEYY